MNIRQFTSLGIVASLLFVCGCGGPDLSHLPRTVDAKGVVTLDGDPVEGASIVLMQDSGEYFARGISDSSGRFSLDAFEGKPGAVPGDYKAQVSKTVEIEGGPAPEGEAAEHATEDAATGWENALPKKYASITTSGLTVTIPEDGITDIKLELISK